MKGSFRHELLENKNKPNTVSEVCAEARRTRLALVAEIDGCGKTQQALGLGLCVCQVMTAEASARAQAFG